MCVASLVATIFTFVLNSHQNPQSLFVQNLLQRVQLNQVVIFQSYFSLYSHCNTKRTLGQKWHCKMPTGLGQLPLDKIRIQYKQFVDRDVRILSTHGHDFQDKMFSQFIFSDEKSSNIFLDLKSKNPCTFLIGFQKWNWKYK